MSQGYLYVLVSLLGYSLLGISHKLADVKQCSPRAITLLLFFWGGVLTTGYVFAAGDYREFPVEIVVIALVFGIFSSLAILSFQAGLKHGKIATSWLIMNLSMAVPAVLSIVIYGEPVVLVKVAAVGMIFLSMFFLWRDKKVEVPDTSKEETGASVSPESTPPRGKSRTAQWMSLMLVAFLLNGLGAFGLRVLVGLELGELKMPYIACWYWSGFALMAATYLRGGSMPVRREFGVSALMGTCSVVGTLGLAAALDSGVAGFVIYPVSVGGGLVLVVLAGVSLFGESVTRPGMLGILIGVGAVLTLALSG